MKLEPTEEQLQRLVAKMRARAVRLSELDAEAAWSLIAPMVLEAAAREADDERMGGCVLDRVPAWAVIITAENIAARIRAMKP
jgi:hypothetical protein